MSSQIILSENKVQIKGDLLFSSVTQIRAELERAMLTTDQLSIDFGRVEKVDSAALSLWLCLQRFANQHKVHISAENVPQELSAIAHLVGLDQQGLGFTGK